MPVDSLTEYGKSFQTNTIIALISDGRFLEQTLDILDSKYFDSEADQWIINSTIKYFRHYHKVPTLQVFKTEIAEINNDVKKVVIIEKVKEVFRTLESKQSDLDFVKDKFLAFAKNQEMKKAILKSVDLLQKKKYSEIKSLIDNAQKAGLSTDLGMRYKEDSSIELRLSELARDVVPTGWPVIDEIMDGGLGKGELGCVVAPSGAGKSWCLVAIAAHAIKKGKNVLLYTLELSQEYVCLRFDAHFTGVASSNLKYNRDTLKEKIDALPGDLIVKGYPTKNATVDTIIAHIKNAKAFDFDPDLVIVDYADLLTGDMRYGQEQKRFELENIYESLRGMAGELELPVWTASQTNREALNDDWIGANRISEAYQKVMISDFIMALQRKNQDKEDNTARISIMKNRFGPDYGQYPAKMHTAYGWIEIFDESTQEGKETKKKLISDEKHTQKMAANSWSELMGNTPQQTKVTDMG